MNRQLNNVIKGLLIGLLLVLLAVLFFNIYGIFHRTLGVPVEEEPLPVQIEEIHNAYILWKDDGRLCSFHNGQEHIYTYAPGLSILSDEIADLVLTDGIMTKVSHKTFRLKGTLLRADSQELELKEYGAFPVAEDVKIYRLYDTLRELSLRQLSYGYDFADFVVDAEGKICAILDVKHDQMFMIRVLCKTNDFKELYHETVLLRCNDSVYEFQREDYPEGTRITIAPYTNTGRVEVLHLKRASENMQYRGEMELLFTKEGIVMINVLPLEEYLYSVVPSEMPASYPLESLKAQAVCARTYAYQRMLRAAYPQYGAHLDDSVSYQVYHNIDEAPAAIQAVRETSGIMLFNENQLPADVYYYSTSCGIGSIDSDVWRGNQPGTYFVSKEISAQEPDELLPVLLQEEDAFRAFIDTRDENHFESRESYYRWNMLVETIDCKLMYERMAEQYKVNKRNILTYYKGEYVSRPISEFKSVKKIKVIKRGQGGVVKELLLDTTGGKYIIYSELAIRNILNQKNWKLQLSNDRLVDSPNLLPSGYFYINEIRNENNLLSGYSLCGGGLGHGVGMSQNGAKAMGKEGYNFQEILHFFYHKHTLFYGREIENGNSL